MRNLCRPYRRLHRDFRFLVTSIWNAITIGIEAVIGARTLVNAIHNAVTVTIHICNATPAHTRIYLLTVIRAQVERSCDAVAVRIPKLTEKFRNSNNVVRGFAGTTRGEGGGRE